jgi:hypothetical protein
MGVNMEISEKLLVEQAWALQVKLARQLEINCYPFSKRQTANGKWFVSYRQQKKKISMRFMSVPIHVTIAD